MPIVAQGEHQRQEGRSGVLGIFPLRKTSGRKEETDIQEEPQYLVLILRRGGKKKGRRAQKKRGEKEHVTKKKKTELSSVKGEQHRKTRTQCQSRRY